MALVIPTNGRYLEPQHNFSNKISRYSRYDINPNFFNYSFPALLPYTAETLLIHLIALYYPPLSPNLFAWLSTILLH